MKDAFIPTKRSKAMGRNFGFVRYNNRKIAENAKAKTNGIWIQDMQTAISEKCNL